MLFRSDTYAQRLADMVKIWRESWNQQGEMPFYSVEIPGWHYQNPEATNAAMLREAQQNSAKIIPNSSVVCTSDLVYPYEVEDIHACKKQEIGERLAFKAANKTYGIYGIACDSPQFESMEVDGNKALLHFSNADDGFTPNLNLEGFEEIGRASGRERVLRLV